MSQRGYRFLKYSDSKQMWEEITPVGARDKVGHALRFAARTKRRSCKNQATKSTDASFDSVSSSSTATTVMSFGSSTGMSTGSAGVPNQSPNLATSAQFEQLSQAINRGMFNMSSLTSGSSNLAGTPSFAAPSVYRQTAQSANAFATTLLNSNHQQQQQAPASQLPWMQQQQLQQLQRQQSESGLVITRDVLDSVRRMSFLTQQPQAQALLFRRQSSNKGLGSAQQRRQLSISSDFQFLMDDPLDDWELEA